MIQVESIQTEMEKCYKSLGLDLAKSNTILSFHFNHSNGATNTIDKNPKEHEYESIKTKTTNNMDQWGLPKSIVAQYHRKGIHKMFDWQMECISNPRVLFDGANLVYSAPTSAGKTLVSEIIMLKNILEHCRKSIFILPFISVVREKMLYLQDLCTGSGLTVEGFYGGYTAPCDYESVNLAVCTIEKANTIVNKLLENGRINQLGCIVVDEIHLISDATRGYLIELLLAKILYVQRRYGYRIQIVAMSATLPNMALLTRWLNAEFFRTDFRPVALQEMLKDGSNVYDREMKLMRSMGDKGDLELAVSNAMVQDQDHVGQLCVETMLENCSVIVFCPTREWCESLCSHIAGFVNTLVKDNNSALGARLRTCLNMKAVNELKEQLRSNVAGLDALLEKTVRYACAFHHAGMTSDEREIIENAFKVGTLRVLVATSTLSSGVNLPARRVIIRTPMFGGKPMNALTYKQMIGRAGRTGKDTVGESILICDTLTRIVGEKLMCSRLPSLCSCLATDDHVHLKRAILEIIASGTAISINDVVQFVGATLLSYEKDPDSNTNRYDVTGRKPTRFDTTSNCGISIRKTDWNHDPILACLNFLLKYEFIRKQPETSEVTELSLSSASNFVATRLGMACLSSSMPPGDGFFLFSELQRARQCFVLESDLHAVYLVTPFSVCYQMQSIDWLSYLEIWEKLPVEMRRVGEMVGVRESFLVCAMRGLQLDIKTLQVHKRFYTALALHELVNETHITNVAAKYKCSRGILQSLQQMASTFAGIVTAFCSALNWNLLALIIGQFKERLYFGVHRELIDLMRLPHLNGRRARFLFKAGIQTLVDLANANRWTVEKILFDCIEFDASRRDGETDRDAAHRNKVRHIYITGRDGFTVQNAALLLIEDARRYLMSEMGVQNVMWESSRTQLIENDIVEIISNNDTPQPTLINNVDVEAGCEHSNQSANKLGLNKDISGKNQAIIIDPLNQSIHKSYEIKPEGKTNVTDNYMAISKSRRIESEHVDVFKLPSSISHSPIQNGIPSERMRTGWTELIVVDICGSVKLFDHFVEVVFKTKAISISVAVSQNRISGIGGHLMGIAGQNATSNNHSNNQYIKKFVFDDGMLFEGVAFCIDDERVSSCFYMNMQNNGSGVESSAKIALLHAIFHRSEVLIRMYDARQHVKTLNRAVPSIHEFGCRFEDPRIANWLLQPNDAGRKELLELVQEFAPGYFRLCKQFEVVDSVPVRLAGSHTAERAAIECLACGPILACQRLLLGRLGNGDILKSFDELEMPIQKSLIGMEITGIAVDSSSMNILNVEIQDLMHRLETNMFKLHGRRFNVASSGDVAEVLDIRDQKKNVPGKVVSTAKMVLRNLVSDPMADMVLQWRRLSAISRRSIRPLQKSLKCGRVHANSSSLTQTGRISMHTPNVQNVAKEFVLSIDSIEHRISCRRIFRCPPQRLLIAADFCQLELRILAHLSCDSQLLQVLRADVGDVFATIAANWNGISESHVTSDQRNCCKQICYGIIYGMGSRAMAASLGCDEDNARKLSESFHQTYPGIQKYIEQIVGFVREKGYVETFAGRRRYFPTILSEANMEEKFHIERQAINTTIQGSASDVTKYAILRMERNLRKYAPAFRLGDALSVAEKTELTIHTQVRLVLHLHDELMYEIPADRIKAVATVLRSSMENCAMLKVPLRVKLKTGLNWEEMQFFDI